MIVSFGAIHVHLLLSSSVLWSFFVAAQLHPTTPARYLKLPSLRGRARIENEWRRERVANVPFLLTKYRVDAWLMSQREHAEDTVWWSLKNATDFDAHRRTVVLFHTNTSTLAGKANPLIWVDNTDTVWPELRSVLDGYDPTSIALNTDRDIAFGGGLHVGEMDALREHLGPKWIGDNQSPDRVRNVPMLAVEFVATKVDGQLKYYRILQEIVWAMLEEGFSHRVIQPGRTTTTDLEWWFREKMQEQNVTTWNQPRVSVITPESFPGWAGTDDVIQEGDLLHIDFGITAMGLNTDTQHMAYVLRTTGTDVDYIGVPDGLIKGLEKSNRMQDIVLEKMRPGLTGNEVLKQSLEEMSTLGIEGQIYSHPIGDWGHDAGAVMGFTNLPKHVPILGDLPILPNTYYSIELYAYHFVPERNETLRFRQEENAYWDARGGSWKFVRGRQEKFHVVDARKAQATVFRIQP